MSKRSSKTVASLAGKVLTNQSSSEIQKKLAASVISQSGTSKTTGTNLETIASKVLQSDKYNETTKTLAGSVLSQAVKPN